MSRRKVCVNKCQGRRAEVRKEQKITNRVIKRHIPRRGDGDDGAGLS